ncbi:tol-pal system protein YbgF [Phenylobacterium sp.]|uniref:tol-pal system protein YbgF n=1 Tax=Phenylobacterium sp. TaxID=1871053 RepID=UPI002728F3DE|nr:tol-pal system protein YbgF [Phenylobacterium sp.]MDO8381313.1 tol-pal system protein YbgF [Phenylobacterium sp.]
MTLRRLALASAAVLTLATPAFAQTPIDPLDARDARRLDRMEQVMRELRSIVFQGRDSGKPVVVQPAETDYQLQELTRRIADLEQALTRVNGQLETTSHDLEQAKRDTEALKRDNKALTDRLGGVEQRQAAPVAEGPAPDLAGGGAVAAGPAPTSSEAFTAARQLMLSGDYTGAEGAFRDYVDRYDDSAKAPEARYWLGKTLSARAAHADAAQAYIGAIRGWPATSWAPDATVELARALVALKKPADACQILGEFDRRYPKAAAAVKGRAAAARTQAKCAA